MGDLGWEDALEKEMATHSSILAWGIPWTEEPGGLESTGSQRVGHEGATSLSLHIHTIPTVYMHTCYMHTHIYTHSLYTHTSIYTYVYIHTRYIHILNIHTFIYAHTYIYTHILYVCYCSVMHLCPILWPHGLQHSRPLCPSWAPRVYSNSRPSSRWCHPAISSSVVPFSSRLQSLPASRVFSRESALRIRWAEYWSFSFSTRPSGEYSGLARETAGGRETQRTGLWLSREGAVRDGRMDGWMDNIL